MNAGNPTTAMHGFTAAVAHVVNDAPQVQAGGIALGLEGEGEDRRLKLMLRHADGTGLVVWLSDPGLGRLGDLLAALYGAVLPAAPGPVVGTVH